ncbi:MAG: phasin, partial [Pseudomonadota bacterium]
MTTAKSKAAPKAAPKTETTDAFAFPAMPDMEVPAAFRDFAENSMTQSKEAYEKFKTAAEEAQAALEETIEKTRDGVIAINSKAIEAAQENTDATLSHAKEVFAVKSFSEAIELQTSFAKKQFEIFQAQTKAFQDMTTKLSEEASAPYKSA